MLGRHSDVTAQMRRRRSNFRQGRNGHENPAKGGISKWNPNQLMWEVGSEWGGGAERTWPFLISHPGWTVVAQKLRIQDEEQVRGGRVTGGHEESCPDHQVLAGSLILRYFP